MEEGGRTGRGLAAVAALSFAFGAGGAAADIRPLPRPTPASAAAQIAEARAEAALFAMPRVAAETRAAFGLLQTGAPDEALAALDEAARRHPDVGALQVDRAALAMRLGEADRAVAALQAAAAAGAPGLGALLADPLFAPLAGDPRLASVATAPAAPAAAPAPRPIVDGQAWVTGANIEWNPESERLEPRFSFPERPSARVLPPQPETAAYDLLREHVRKGRAAGNHGDLYDNRDRGHSALPWAAHPQVTHVAYAAAAKAADVDYGLADQVLFDRITFGNSSTAITDGATWRSLPRLAMTQPDGTGPLRLWQNAAANHLYVYPAHKDYGSEAGDLFPANTPYVLISRGSSGSDQILLEAVALILAAFRPDTKALLAEEGLATSTVQMVFRRSLQNVLSREDYFSGKAHPAAFEGYQVNLARMVSLAQSIAADAVPPQVRIQVVEEELGVEGIDFFGAGLSEQLFDTPSAVARIWRSTAGRRSMVVSAAETRDPNGRPLAFHWRLLQGDPDRVRIEPLGDGSSARITIDWHDPFPISEDNPLVSARVDVGVFADNGAHDSAPAILSWYFPPHEARTYAPGPDGAPRIVAVDYAARPEVYADPMLLPRAAWRDVHRYAPDGTPLGWTRMRDVGTETFAPDGARLGPAGAAPVVYALTRDATGALIVEETPAGSGDGDAGPD